LEAYIKSKADSLDTKVSFLLAVYPPQAQQAALYRPSPTSAGRTSPCMFIFSSHPRSRSLCLSASSLSLPSRTTYSLHRRHHHTFLPHVTAFGPQDRVSTRKQDIEALSQLGLIAKDKVEEVWSQLQKMHREREEVLLRAIQVAPKLTVPTDSDFLLVPDADDLSLADAPLHRSFVNQEMFHPDLLSLIFDFVG